MSLFVEGMKCRLCGKPMRRAEGLGIKSFRSFVSNAKDPLIVFHDASVHEECFRSHPLARQAADRLDAIARLSKDWPPNCAVCGLALTDPDDWIAFGYLTDDSMAPFSRYNCLFLHRQCVVRWDELDRARAVLEEAQASGNWGGPVLEGLLRDLRPELRDGHSVNRG